MAGKATIKMSGDAAQLAAANDAVIRRQGKMLSALRKTTTESRKGATQANRMAGAHNEAFGPRATQQIRDTGISKRR